MKDFLFSANAEFLEQLYQEYLANKTLPQEWQEYFDLLEGKPRQIIKEKVKENIFVKTIESSSSIKYKAFRLIDAYRQKGHYLCRLDPLNIDKPKEPEDLALRLQDFDILDDKLICPIDSYAFGVNTIGTAALFAKLQKTYAGSIGVEFEHVQNEAEKKWLYAEFENIFDIELSKEIKQMLLTDVLEVESFEGYLNTKFPGFKRFSIEGSESVIVAAEIFAKYCIDNPDISELIVGMSHRGRISLLTNIAHKPYHKVFSEFTYEPERNLSDYIYSSDVKYHLGYSDEKNKLCKVHVLNNPSHLESINPVMVGVMYAKNKYISKHVAGLAIHGDGAFCGQGVVAETLSMTTLAGYKTKGILHLIVNNQIGFTADTDELRVSRYPTEFAKSAQIPILHVNGHDLESTCKAINFAIKYKEAFKKDIIIDIFGYRKQGHNEGDEPSYTQGPMYSIIRNLSPISQNYAQTLIEQKVIDENFVANVKRSLKDQMDSDFAKISKPIVSMLPQEDLENPITGVKITDLKALAQKIFTCPQGVAMHPKLVKLFEQKLRSVLEEESIDWSIAEALAFASLIKDGINIRLSGQDAIRGTFSQRHSMIHSQTDSKSSYAPLNSISPNASFEVYNSFLSEFAVSGFEYGYSIAKPNDLVIWEAQFGDFANGAQIIFDQFVSAALSKWRQQSSLVALLPHGFEGQGPEHSSARVERFLSLAAQNNMQISLCSNPASYFHLLRRQSLQKAKRPLIVFTPKSLLRHRLAVSHLSEFAEDKRFVKVIDDKLDKATKIIFCSGKVYYDLIEYRAQHSITNIAIVRIEQYYPFPEYEIVELVKKYQDAVEIILCQEEPQNMGAYYFLYSKMLEILPGKQIKYVGRPASSSPACGYASWHKQEQELLIKQALGN